MTRKVFTSLFVLFLLGLICGTYSDLEISMALYEIGRAHV